MVPAKAKLKSIKAGKKKITVTVKKQAGAEYQIQYRERGKSSWKSVNASSTKKVIKSLMRGKKYQVRIRAYTTINGKRMNGAWSAVKVSGKVK